MGRKTQATPWLTHEGLSKIAEWASMGLTNKDIAYNVGIKESTFYEWLKKYPELSDTLKNAKKIADQIVENALYKRALGYSYEEVTSFIDEEGNVTGRKTVTKHVLGDVTAEIFWLKNRQPEKWRNHPDNAIENVQDTQDDGFMEALSGTAAADWADIEDGGDNGGEA